MKKSILFLSLLTITGSIMAQKVTTTSAVVSFDATTPKDALPKAENKTVIASFDKGTGAVAFEAAVNNFAFSNPKIQEHFNGANWMNSASFPKFSFDGNVDKINKVKFKKDGTYKVKVTGNLTVKGIAKPVSAPAFVTVSGGAISAVASFKIKLADYGIAGAPIDGGKVSKEPKVTVSASFN